MTQLRKLLEGPHPANAWEKTPLGRIIEAHLEKVGDAAFEVQVAIRKYVEAHEAVLELDGVPNSVLKLAARGVATGNRAREQWNVLGDDGHVMSYAMERHFEGMKADE